MATLYCGTWYLSGDIDEDTKVVLFVVILMSTLIFVVKWLKEYIRSTVHNVKFLKRFQLEKEFMICKPYFPDMVEDESYTPDRKKFFSNTIIGRIPQLP